MCHRKYIDSSYLIGVVNDALVGVVIGTLVGLNPEHICDTDDVPHLPEFP